MVGADLDQPGPLNSITIFYQYADMPSKVKSRGKYASVDWATVGRRIREMRGFDMTQEEFAERIGISQNYLSTMERGKVEIGAEILLRISQEFAKSVEWLLTGKG
jgi:DNA-binding XRE family transcriptional regulator